MDVFGAVPGADGHKRAADQPPEHPAACHAATGGEPFFLTHDLSLVDHCLTSRAGPCLASSRPGGESPFQTKRREYQSAPPAIRAQPADARESVSSSTAPWNSWGVGSPIISHLNVSDRPIGCPRLCPGSRATASKRERR